MTNFQYVNIKIYHLKIASVSYLGGIGIFLYIFMSNKIIVYYNDVILITLIGKIEKLKKLKKN